MRGFYCAAVLDSAETFKQFGSANVGDRLSPDPRKHVALKASDDLV